MAVIERRETKEGEPRFRVKIRFRKLEPITATFTRLGDAKKFVALQENKLRLEHYGLSTPADNHSAEEMIDRYLRTIHKTKSTKKNFLNRQRQQLKWWKKELAGLTIAQVTPAVLSEKRELLQATRASSTVNNYMSALSFVFGVAIREWQWLEVSPFSKINKLKLKNAGLRFLAEDEIKALLKACAQQKKKPLLLIVAMALATAARKNEILNLKWADLDLVNGSAVALETKNSEPRRLYFGIWVLNMLRAHQAAQTRPGRILAKCYVFGNRFGNKPARIDEEFAQALKVAGIKKFRFHDLRHTAASHMAMNKANASDIAEVLGHKSLDMVKRYAHLSQKHTAQVVASMNEKIFGGMA